MKKLNKPILAEGETTGHCHTLSDKTEIFETNDNTRIFQTEGDTLTHQEHQIIEIPAGEYESGKVLEYDPAIEEAREVQD